MAKNDYEYGQNKANNRLYVERLKEKQSEDNKLQDSLIDRLKSIGISGAISGTILGAGGAALGGVRGLSRLAKAGLMGGAGSSALATGANLVGSAIEPSQDEEDSTINTRRGLYGGLLAGGLAGGALGALGATGKLKPLYFMSSKMPSNIFTDYIAKTAASSLSSPAKAVIGGAIGGGALGSAGGFVGADEGMQYDTIMNEARKRGLIQ